jgi:hypothetical protein
MLSRSDVLQAHTRANRDSVPRYLAAPHAFPPFGAVQVDGGSEFAAQFEQALPAARLQFVRAASIPTKGMKVSPI